MNEALRQRLEAIARRNHEEHVEEGRRITFRVCRLCGFAKWAGSSGSEGGFSVALNDDAFDHENGCEFCMDVFRRAPEVAQWVLAVIRFADMMKQPEEKI